jgi:hypothetical protein
MPPILTVTRHHPSIPSQIFPSVRISIPSALNFSIFHSGLFQYSNGMGIHSQLGKPNLCEHLGF